MALRFGWFALFTMSNSIRFEFEFETKLGTEVFRNLDLPEFWIFCGRPFAKNGGACRDRTDDLKLAKLALSQLS
jgi:hypothetical protein